MIATIRHIVKHKIFTLSENKIVFLGQGWCGTQEIERGWLMGTRCIWIGGMASEIPCYNTVTERY